MEPLSKDEVGAALEGIERELDRVEEIMIEVSTGATTFLTEFTTYLTKAGGKRLRPALVILSASITGPPVDDVFKIAAAIELTHLATLYHDDVIDEADTRRGVPSANERWGNKVAILAGDYLFARASRLAAEVGGEAPMVLGDAIARVVSGQVQELQSTFDPRRSAEQYLTTIDGKTASLIEASTRLGAGLATVEPRFSKELREFGSAFGYAFQIADDLLDIAASWDELGKRPGTDIRDGVYTLPVILAAETDPSIYDRLGGPDVDIDEIREAVIAAGGFKKAQVAAEEYTEKALSILSQLPASEARTALDKITRLVIERVPAV